MSNEGTILIAFSPSPCSYVLKNVPLSVVLLFVNQLVDRAANKAEEALELDKVSYILGLVETLYWLYFFCIPPRVPWSHHRRQRYFHRIWCTRQVRMMDKLALEMETFEEILERFEVDVAQAKLCGDYTQMVSRGFGL